MNILVLLVMKQTEINRYKYKLQFILFEIINNQWGNDNRTQLLTQISNYQCEFLRKFDNSLDKDDSTSSGYESFTEITNIHNC